MKRHRVMLGVSSALLVAALVSPLRAQVAGVIYQIAGVSKSPVKALNFAAGATYNATNGVITVSGGGLGDGGVTAQAPLAGLGTAASPLGIHDGGVGNQYLASATTTVNGGACTLGGTCTVTAQPSPTPTTGNILVGNGTSWASQMMSGDVALLATGVATVGGLQSRYVSNAAPVNGYVLTWDAALTQWEPQTLPTGLSGPLPTAQGTLAAPVTLTSTTWVDLITASITPTATAYVTANAQAGWTGANSNSTIGLRISIDGYTSPTLEQITSGTGHAETTGATVITSAPLTQGVAATIRLQGQLIAGGNITVSAADLAGWSLQGSAVTSGVAAVTGTAPITSSGGASPAIGLSLAASGGLQVSGSALAVSYGSTAGTSTQGNDTRLNVAPSVAGGVAYDTSTAWSRTAAGTTTQVLHGGTAPSFGAVNLATDTTGTLAATSLPTTGTAGTYGGAVGSGSAGLISTTTDAYGRVSSASTSQTYYDLVSLIGWDSGLFAGTYTIGYTMLPWANMTSTGCDFYWPTATASRSVTCTVWSGVTAQRTCSVNASAVGTYGCNWATTYSMTAKTLYKLSVWDSTGTSQIVSNATDYGLPVSSTRWGLLGPNLSISFAQYAAGNAAPVTQKGAMVPLMPRFTVP